MNEETKKLEDYGKFALISHLTEDFETKNESTKNALHDDAAVVGLSDTKTLVTNAVMVEGIHFDMMYTPLKHLGYKAVANAVSNIAAMNATARQIIVNVAISSRYTIEAMEDFFDGIRFACGRYDLDLVSCDITSSVSGMMISTTAIGEAEEQKITTRGGAKVHDLLCASGDFGSAYAGLLILEREKATYKANPQFQPDLSSHEYVIERFLKPEPRTDIVDWLDENGIVPTSMTNVGDGLASAAIALCRESHCGCEIYEEKIPIDYGTTHVCTDFGPNMLPTSFAMNGGGDNELLFTVNQSDYEKIKDCENISIIGHITEEARGAIMVTPQNSAIELKAQGWK